MQCYTLAFRRCPLAKQDRVNVPKLRFKPFLKKLLLLVVGLTVGVVVAEAALWALGVGYPLRYQPDAHCGTRLRADFDGWFTREGRAQVRTNSAGHRDREHSESKPANTFRIAVLGDSFAEAPQVDLEQTFWAVMEGELQSCEAFGGLDVEVLNFGVSGFGTAQELQMLRHYVWPYEPDLVLLAFFAGNDVSDNSQQLRPGEIKPYFTIENDELVLDDSFLEHPDYLDARSNWTQFKVRAINHSRILQLIAEARHASSRRQTDQEVQAQWSELGLDSEVYAEPANAEWRGAWEVTQRLIVEMRDEVRQHGAEFWVVSVSSAVQVDPDPDLRADFAAAHKIDDLSYPDKRIETLGEHEQFSVIALAPRMQEHAQEEGVYLHGFENTRLGTGHWNADGHRLAGKWIAEAICNSRDQD